MSDESTLERVLEWLIDSEDANKLELTYYGPPLERPGGRLPFESGDLINFGSNGGRSGSYTLSTVLDYAWQSIKNIFKQADRLDAKGRAHPAQPGFVFWINYAHFCRVMHDRGTPVVDPATGKEQYWEGYTDDRGNYWEDWQQARALYERERLDLPEAYLSEFLKHCHPPKAKAKKTATTKPTKDLFMSDPDRLQEFIKELPPDKAAEILSILSRDYKPKAKPKTKLSLMIEEYMQRQGLADARVLTVHLFESWRLPKPEGNPAFVPSVHLLEAILRGEEPNSDHPAYVQVMGFLASVLADGKGKPFAGNVTRFLEYIESNNSNGSRI